MSTIVAKGSNYFGINGFPIVVGRSRTASNNSKEAIGEHDLTEVEHTHDCSELVIVKQGQGLQNLKGSDHPITAGDVFLLQGQQQHFFHHRKNLELINVMYDHELLALPESELRRMPGYSAMFLLEPSFRQQHRFESHLHLDQLQLADAEHIISAMEIEHKDKVPGYEVILRAKLLELITYLSRLYHQGESNETQALLRVGNVIGGMESDFTKDWKLDELAEIAHMSKSNLLTVFRKATGQTPIEYLVKLRIQRAMEMLQETKLPITEIAFAVGFNDSNYFTRQFKKATGTPPRQFRTQT